MLCLEEQLLMAIRLVDGCAAERIADARSSRYALRRASLLVAVGCGGVMGLLSGHVQPTQGQPR